jgi:hypothetical protein
MVKNGSYQGLGSLRNRMLKRAAKAATEGTSVYSKKAAPTSWSLAAHSKAAAMLQAGAMRPPAPPPPPRACAASSTRPSTPPWRMASDASPPTPPAAMAQPPPMVVSAKMPPPIPPASLHSPGSAGSVARPIIESIEFHESLPISLITFVDSRFSQGLSRCVPVPISGVQITRWELSPEDSRKLYITWPSDLGLGVLTEVSIRQFFERVVSLVPHLFPIQH